MHWKSLDNQLSVDSLEYPLPCSLKLPHQKVFDGQLEMQKCHQHSHCC